MAGSVIGLLSVIPGFLPPYYRFLGECVRLALLSWQPQFAKNFDDQITPNNAK
jgi:hypothetical protein